MEQSNIWMVLATLITTLGSVSAWNYYEKRARIREKSDNFMKEDCKERITKLEAMLEKSYKEKDVMMQQILDLTSKVSELTVKVDFLQKEKN